MTDSLKDVVSDLNAEAERLRCIGNHMLADAYQQLANRLSALAAPVVSDEIVARHVEVLSAMRTMFSEKRIPSPCEEREALDAAIAALSPGRSGEVDRG